MHLRSLSLAAVTLAGTAVAQITSPVGYDTTEGNAVFFHFGGNRRFQSIDSTQTATGVWSTFALRRDGPTAFNAGYTARTFDYRVVFSSTAPVVVSNTFDDNLIGATTVYALRSTNFPDWTNPPTTPPAPFDFSVTLDAPYVHLGGTFVWDIEHSNNTSTVLVTMDRHYNAYASASGVALAGSVGCIATGRTTAFAHTTALRNGSPSAGPIAMNLLVTPSNCPSTSPVLLSIDTVDSALALPFLCRPLHALPTILLPIGTSTATGTLTAKAVAFPYAPGLVGASLVTQLVSPDVGQPAPFLPLALSNGRMTTMPADPVLPSIGALYIWQSAVGVGVSGSSFWGGSAIARLQ